MFESKQMFTLLSPFQRRHLVCSHSVKVFFKVYNSLLYSLRTHKIWKRSVEKYKSYGTLSKTTQFLRVFCETGVVQQCPEAQAGVVQDGLKKKNACMHRETKIASIFSKKFHSPKKKKKISLSTVSHNVHFHTE